MTTTPQPHAIFFDLDGTLLDPSDATLEDDWRASVQTCCDGSYDIEQLLRHVHAVRHWFWGDTDRARRGRLDLNWARTTIVQEAFERAGWDSNIALASQIGADYFERREAAMALHDAATSILNRVRADGIRTALITNGGAAMQRSKVDRFGLEQYFDCIVIEGEFGAGKPDERVFRHALTATGCEPERTWMIGDNFDADIVTPHRLGMYTWWIDATGAGVPADAAVQPHRVIASVADFLP